MLLEKRRRTRIGGGALLLSLVALAGVDAPAASAAGPPEVVESWAYTISATTGRLAAKINPHEATTTYHFDYITKAAYDLNVAEAKEPFTGASRIPLVADANIGSSGSPVGVLQLLSGLKAETTYYYRVGAKNSQSGGNYVYGVAHTFTTQPSSIGADTCANKTARDQQHSSYLPDCRGYEMVTPIDKNGGQAGAPESIADGGLLQAASGGGSVTYGSEASFAEGGQGAPPLSQYVATRSSAGWSALNISPPLFSGTYDSQAGGAPYQLFSPDLSLALLLNGAHCRGEGGECAVQNPPLAGTDAPPGYQNYYVRDNGASTFEALLGDVNAGFLTLDPAHFDLFLAGTAPDLEHGVLSTCAALTAGAGQEPLGEGCDPGKQNLYEYGSGALALINVTPGAMLAAQSGAISEDGSRVYWEDLSQNIFLHEGASNESVGVGDFQVASSTGAFAFYIDSTEHLKRYDASTHSSTDLTPGGGVQGVLGISANGDTVYFQDSTGLKRWHGSTTTVAPGAAASEPGDYLDDDGTARVSSDGTKLLFVSKAQLTGYDNTDLSTGNPDLEVFFYDSAGGTSLTCISCNPTNGRPIGGSSVPGKVANGSTEDSLEAYLPRILSANGKRVFFDSSDSLYLSDTNSAADVYQWEAQGEGSCAKAGGCVSLISDGRAATGSRFVDASADGADAFFLSAASLIEADPGALDLYDARAVGGFVVPVPPIPCKGDACQSLPSEPVDPTLTTILPGPGNPPVRYPTQEKRCKKGFVKRKGKCVRQHKRRATRSRRRRAAR
jgi:hypothetical protein